MELLARLSYLQLPNPQISVAVAAIGTFTLLLGIFAWSLRSQKSFLFDIEFLKPYLKFAYVSFLKPHTARRDGGQQSALESFYAAQVCMSNPLLWR